MSDIQCNSVASGESFGTPRLVRLDRALAGGRQPIAVNQPPGGGTDYPFVKPSADLQYLLGDFYLSYRDDACQFQPPFRVAWLYGFGETVVAEIPGYPTPTHAHDLLVLDADDAVVFDSTAAISYGTRAWGDRLLIVEWISDTAVCRLTKHVGWEPEDIEAGAAQSYDLYLAPAGGDLDPDTYQRAVPSLRSIRVGAEQLSGHVRLESGYNASVSLVTETDQYAVPAIDLEDLADTANKATVRGTRLSSQLLLQATPGAGLGQYPGCDEEQLGERVVRKINSIGPDESGEFALDAEGCLWTSRPLALAGTAPRSFLYPGPATLKLHNPCGPCCTCDYFVRTYKGLKRQWNLWRQIAVDAQTARDLMLAVQQRWTAAKSCREANSIRLVSLPEGNCKVALGTTFCNTTKCCATPLVLRFSFEYREGGAPAVPLASDCLATLIDGSPQKNIPERYTLSGSWPVYEATFDYADPQSVSRVAFRLCLNQCPAGSTLKTYVTAHYPDMLPPENSELEACEVRLAEVPAALSAIWGGAPTYPARALAEGNAVPLNPTADYCLACECSGG